MLLLLRFTLITIVSLPFSFSLSLARSMTSDPFSRTRQGILDLDLDSTETKEQLTSSQLGQQSK